MCRPCYKHSEACLLNLNEFHLQIIYFLLDVISLKTCEFNVWTKPVSIDICTLECHSGTCREYLQIIGIWAVFFSFSFTSWHYGYLCAFFRAFRDAGPRHRCVLVLQMYKFVSFTQKELLYSVSVFSKRTFGLVRTTCQAWTTIGHFYFSAACFWCPYHFSASDMSVCCAGISGEEIPDGAGPPPINGTLAPEPGECIYHATNTLNYTYWTWMGSFWEPPMFVWALFCFKLVNLICGEECFCWHVDTTRTLWHLQKVFAGRWNMRSIFLFFGSQADITDICAHFSGPSETLAPDTGAFWCCKYVTLHLVSKQTWWMQYLFSPREHLHELQPHPKSKPSSAISVSVLHSCGAPIIFLQLISGFPVWVFQEKKFLMVLALPPSMGL